MAIRMIKHPGVEIREVDRSQYQPAIVGTYGTIFGFTDKGEDLSPAEVGNMQDFRDFYGEPTNEAERYAYYASNEVLKNGGSLIFGKIPYNNDISRYYQGIALNVNDSNPISGLLTAATSANDAGFAILSNVCTVTSNSHGLEVGEIVTISDIGNLTGSISGSVSGSLTVTEIVSNNIFKYSCTQDIAVSGTLDWNIGSRISPSNYSNHAAMLTGYNNTTSYFEVSAAKIVMPNNAYDLLAAGGSFADVSNISTFGGSYDYLSGTNDKAEVAAASFIIINENKARLENDDSDGGIFIKLVDLVDAMKYQRLLSNTVYNSTGLSGQATLMNMITGIQTVTGTIYTDDSLKLTRKFVNDISGSSYSEDMARYFPTLELSGNGDYINPEYNNYVGILVCKTFADENNEGKLSIAILESHVGSIHKFKKDKATGNSVYICDVVNTFSRYIKMYQNQNIDPQIGANQDSVDVINKTDANVIIVKDEIPTLLGFNQEQCKKYIKYSDITSALTIMLEKISNIDELQVDLLIDAGLSTIAEFVEDGATGSLFLPELDPNDNVIQSSDDLTKWRAICDKYISFCKDTRKDCMTILDVPRNLVLEGNEKFIRKTKPSNTFGITIGRKLRYCTGLNSSYAAIYSNWMRMVDDFTGNNYWFPESVKVGGVYIYNDTVANIWDAPAGLNRGVITGINDLSFNPNGKDADQLYEKSFNYAKQYPLDGFIVEGQKTTQAKPSAFDRVNVRRLFLRLERLVYQSARYFVYEPNNIYTRRRLVDTIAPIFSEYKNKGGIYDYKIVCDETNNTAEVIDRNELKVAILIKATRTAEFILCDFISTRTGANFDEVLQELR